MSGLHASMLPLRILLLSDGRPGHFNLAEGIAEALLRRRAGAITRLDVRRGRWPGHLLAVALAAGLPPEIMLRRVYGLDPKALPSADVIVSAGAETLAANICASRILRVPNIFYGSLRWFRPSDFALVLTSYAEDARGPNQRMTLKPCRIDPDRLPPIQRAPGKPPRVAALLLGGNSPGIAYGALDWSRLKEFLAASHTSHGTRWIVSTSRRTPAAVADDLAGVAGSRADGAIARLVDVRQPGAEGLGGILAEAEAVVCTADSSTMLSEAAWMRRPVLAVSPAQFTLEAREHAYRRYLADRNLSRTLPIALLSPATFLAALGQMTPYPGNAADDLAMFLSHQLPALFSAADAGLVTPKQAP